jgi:hypothetical protein
MQIYFLQRMLGRNSIVFKSKAFQEMKTFLGEKNGLRYQ